MTVNTFILNDLEMGYLLSGLSTCIFDPRARSCKFFRHDPLSHIDFKIINIKGHTDKIRPTDTLAMTFIEDALFIRNETNHNGDGKYAFTMNDRDQDMVKKLLKYKNRRDKKERLDKVRRILQSNIRYSFRKL